MKSKAVLIGGGIVALLLLVVWIAGTWALSPAPAVASNPPTLEHQAVKGQSVPGVPACYPESDWVPSYGMGDINNLSAVAAISAFDVWAVGDYYSGTLTFGFYQTLIEHWDGNTWNVFPSPNPGGTEYDNELYAVAAVSTNDVWAVGCYDDGARRRTLVEHWNGDAWSVVSSSSPGDQASYLYGVSVVSANDVWAVGYYANTSTSYSTLVEHWNGNAWIMVSSPNPGPDISFLYAVSAVSATDVWAVGYYHITSTTFQQLVEHWDGTVWTALDFGRPTAGTRNYLYAVSAVSATDVWAVGAYSPDGTTYFTVVERWDGSQWNWLSSPSVGRANYLYAVAAVSDTDVWAVGEYVYGSGTHKMLVEHWNGSEWSWTSGYDPFGEDDYLYGVTAVSQSEDIWAVGSARAGYYRYTMVERYYDRACSTSTPTPLPTNVPGITNTPPPHHTPTATSTSHTTQFTDVPQDSPFYPYISCLIGRGLVSGYTAGCESGNPCFRPGNNITRGQLAKIVANAAGFAEQPPSSQQTFEDVPHDNAFWLYIERVYAHQVINGYPGDGVTANPCTGQPEMTARLYFRPCNNATRGQIAKIDSAAAGYSDTIPSAQQTFDDVPQSNSFWLSIERVHLHQVINGYAGDGRTVNPCTGQVEQSGHLNFHPCNNATRGQTSKIVANTFFPNCTAP